MALVSHLSRGATDTLLVVSPYVLLAPDLSALLNNIVVAVGHVALSVATAAEIGSTGKNDPLQLRTHSLTFGGAQFGQSLHFRQRQHHSGHGVTGYAYINGK